MIIFVALILFALILIGLVYTWKKEKESQQKTADLFARISVLSEGITDIGFIQPSKQIKLSPKIESNYVRLSSLSRIYKYTDARDYWIEFILENITTENVNFILDTVEFFYGDTKIESNLTLLLEKVPEYIAPPYGDNYFSTKSYNNFTLGT